jgi:hypothetical protein
MTNLYRMIPLATPGLTIPPDGKGTIIAVAQSAHQLKLYLPQSGPMRIVSVVTPDMEGALIVESFSANNNDLMHRIRDGLVNKEMPINLPFLRLIAESHVIYGEPNIWGMESLQFGSSICMTLRNVSPVPLDVSIGYILYAEEHDPEAIARYEAARAARLAAKGQRDDDGWDED